MHTADQQMHKARIADVLAGRQPDRLPVSVWGHDFLREGSAADLAAQTVERYRQHNYDFVKINPRWTLFAEPWGNRYQAPAEQKFPRLIHRVVERPEDLSEIPEVESDCEVLSEHVQAVQLICQQISAEVDCLATVFSPLAVLGLLAGGVGPPLLSMLHSHPEHAHDALGHISATLGRHARDLIDAGASGIFYAPLPWTSLDVCDAATYRQFGEQYDREVLRKVEDARFNMLHICGDNVGMQRFYSYPVPVLNWDNFGVGNPSLHDVLQNSDKIVAGGIPHRRLHKLDIAALDEIAQDALGGHRQRVLLAGGCGIGAMTPDRCRDAVSEVAGRLA